MKNIKYLIIAVAVTLISCDAWEDAKKIDGSDRSKNLYELLSANSDVSTFVKVLDATGYDEKFAADMNYTVFAPSNSALTGLDLNNTEKLKEWILNYVSEKIAYTDKSGIFDIKQIQMLNTKFVSVNNNLVSGAKVSEWNLAAKNGVLHIVDSTIEDRMNIWQYLQSLTNEPIVDFIASFSERTMDMERSIQTGVNGDGKPVYDTVWTNINTLLDNSPLARESATATFILPSQDGLDALKVKYAKYFAQKDSEKLDSVITREIVSDMILRNYKIEADGRYPNNSGVLVDIKVGDITESYTASNGIVYKVNAANVKMFQNKIRPVTIEAENYVSRWPDAWQTRPRTWASGGQDVVLKSRTRHSYDWEETVIYDDTLKSVITGADSIVVRDSIRINKVNNSFDLTYRNNEWPGVNVLGEPNAYISYKPYMYSTEYKIFWKAYDDNAEKSHIDSRGVPMLFHQKMYISFPGENELTRTTTTNVITGNFSSNTIMAAEMHAGENIETQLIRYLANNGHSVYRDSYVLMRPQITEDVYGKEDILKCPYAGRATFFVSNTTFGEFTHFDNAIQAYLQANKSSNSPGMIFLDYIRLEPQVDPND